MSVSSYVSSSSSLYNRAFKGSYNSDVFPIDTFNEVKKIVNSGGRAAKEVFKTVFSANEETLENYPIFLTDAKFINLLFHLNAQYQVKYYNNVSRKITSPYVRAYRKYLSTLTHPKLEEYNYIDVYLLLCNTIQDKLTFWRFCGFLQSFCKTISYIVDTVFKYVQNDPTTVNKDNEDLRQNKIFNKLKTEINKSASSKSIKNNLLYSIWALQIIHEYYFISNSKFRNSILLTNSDIDMSGMTGCGSSGPQDYFFKSMVYLGLDRTEPYHLNPVFNPSTSKGNKSPNVLFLMRDYMSNFLASPNQLINNVITRSLKNSPTAEFFSNNPFMWIYNHNQQFRYNLMSYVWNSNVLLSTKDIFVSLFEPHHTFKAQPKKEVNIYRGIPDTVQFAWIFRDLFIMKEDDKDYKYKKINLYILIKYVNIFLKNKGISMEFKRLPFKKSTMRSSMYGQDLDKTILAGWQTVPYRYNVVQPKFNLQPAYNNLAFISSCCATYSLTGKSGKIEGSTSAMSSMRTSRPPTVCKEIHIFTYNGDESVSEATFDLERRSFAQKFLKQTFIDIFKIELKRETMLNPTKMIGFSSSVWNYYDVSLNMNLQTQGSRLPLYFPGMKKKYTKKNVKTFKEVCLCKNYKAESYLQFIKIERGIVYLYEDFFERMIKTFITPEKDENQNKNKVSKSYKNLKTEAEINSKFAELQTKLNSGINNSMKRSPEYRKSMEKMRKNKKNAITKLREDRKTFKSCSSNANCNSRNICNKSIYKCIKKKQYGGNSDSDTDTGSESSAPTAPTALRRPESSSQTVAVAQQQQHQQQQQTKVFVEIEYKTLLN